MPARSAKPAATLAVKPLTAARFDDFVELFGPKRGASGGCWCMFWRQTPEEWRRRTNDGNRRAMRRIVGARRRPGLLAYRDGKPVGWISVAPRKEFVRLEGSRTLGPIDDAEVWSVVCFYIKAGQRAAGVGTALLRAAVDEAAKRGATTLEAYPVDTAGRRASNGDVFTGLLPMFTRAGFREVARRHPSRPIVRKKIHKR
jgi:GNAT superfamily N-acetyltransferase